MRKTEIPPKGYKVFNISQPHVKSLGPGFYKKEEGNQWVQTSQAWLDNHYEKTSQQKLDNHDWETSHRVEDNQRKETSQLIWDNQTR